MGDSFFECVDAGSENCPCYLALTNDCMTCSRLQGQDYCDCSWVGVCIYNEFIWNNKKAKNPREEIETKIINKKTFDKQVVVFELETSQYLSQRFKYPGTYIFVRSPEDHAMYDVPISIMSVDSERDRIHIAIKIISAKTKKIAAADKTLIIRGPYRNGILGLNKIKNAVGGKMLVLCKSMGIAPAVNFIEYYNESSKIDLISDINRLPYNFAREYLKDCETQIRYLNFKDLNDLEYIKSLVKQKKYDSIMLFTSDKYISIFDALLKSIDENQEYAVVNNFNICCGEGVCGSCSVTTKEGKVVKMCKCQMSGKEVFERGQKHV